MRSHPSLLASELTFRITCYINELVLAALVFHCFLITVGGV